MERLNIAMQPSVLCCAFWVTALSTMSGLQSDAVQSLATNKQLKNKQANRKTPAKQKKKIQHSWTAE